MIAPFPPVPFLGPFIDERQLLLPGFRVDVVALAAALLDEGAKGIVWIILDGLEDIPHRSTLLLVGVKDHIHAIREVLIIAVECHSLDVLLSIYQNADLSIAGLTQGQISHTTAKFHGSVPLEPAFFGIANLQPG